MRPYSSGNISFESHSPVRIDFRPRYFWKRWRAGLSSGVSTSSGYSASPTSASSRLSASSAARARHAASRAVSFSASSPSVSMSSGRPVPSSSSGSLCSSSSSDCSSSSPMASSSLPYSALPSASSSSYSSQGAWYALVPLGTRRLPARRAAASRSACSSSSAVGHVCSLARSSYSFSTCSRCRFPPGALSTALLAGPLVDAAPATPVRRRSAAPAGSSAASTRSMAKSPQPCTCSSCPACSAAPRT
mmetsp:Transcript_16419/g.51019  ORF Transcript_16419/g.51019 Transcript_16419/m.51019 type:complete len:247 (-) Transcript_16419:737-1477(-)